MELLYKKRCYMCTHVPGVEVINTFFQPPAFHKFPISEDFRKKWIDVCHLDEKTDNVSNLCVCSLHFKLDDYVDLKSRDIGGKIRLKKNAVPIKRLKSVPVEEKTVTSPDVEQTGESMTETFTIVIEKCDDKTANIDIKEEPTESPTNQYKLNHYVKKWQKPTSIKLNTTIDMAKRIMSEKNKRLKRLADSNRKFVEKLNKLESILDYLLEEKLISQRGETLLRTCILE